MKQFLQRAALMAVALCTPLAVQAQVSLTTPGAPVTINFDTLPTSGSATWTNNSTVPGWFHARTGTGTTIVANNGSNNAGNLYSYGTGTATDRALGSLGSGNAAVGNLYWGVRLQNNTGATITSLEVSFVGEQWRNSAAAAQTLAFSYLVGSPTVTGSLAEFQSAGTAVAALNFTSPVTGGTAGALDGNATANRVALSTTISGLSIPNGTEVMLRWADPDHTGADHGLAIDDVVVTVPGAPVPSLSIDDVTQLEGDGGTANFTFTVSLSSPAPAGGISVDFATASDSATSGVDFAANSGTLNIAAGSTFGTITVVVTGDTSLEINETFLVALSNASGASIADGTGVGTITNDDIVITAIHDIQGNGELSPVDGSLVMTEGVVTAKRGNGFFLQAADADVDADPATSEGIFVFTSVAPNMVAVGDRARVVATVDEFFGSSATPTTELVSPSVSVLASGLALPAAVELTATWPAPDSLPDVLERLEGMRVSVASGVVTAQTDGNINEANATSSDSNSAFEFVVTGVPRPMREPGISILDPFPVPPAKQATIPYFDANQERIKAFPLVGTRVVADAGATVTGLAGVLTYFGDSWELLYDAANPPIVGTATASAVSDPSANDITVAGFNLLRFFDTVNDPAIGEPVLTPAAFANRLAKTGAAICDWVKAPDILGVVEVENLGTLTELANYINGNCASAPAYVPYLMEGNDVGGIDVGFLVSTRAVNTGVARVEVVSVAQMGKNTQYGTSPLGCTPGDAGCTSALLNDRPSLVLRAAVHFADGRAYPLTVIANHLRSLNGNDDPEDSRVRYKRAEQAMELANYVNGLQTANPGEKIVLVGDFNAFPFNDGYVDSMGIITGNAAPEDQVIEYRASPVVTPLVLGDELTADAAQRYSYVFEGNAQTLDHAVVNEALVNDPAVAGLTVEHARINADFRVAHYGEFSLPYTAANPPLRVSDHDPVRLSISVVRPASADLSLAWATTSMSSRGAFTTLTVHNGGTTSIAGAQVRIDLEIPAHSTAAVGPPSGWTCQRLGDASFLCTANKVLAPATNNVFTVTVRPRVRFAATDSIRFEAQATVISDPISGDNSAVLVLP